MQYKGWDLAKNLIIVFQTFLNMNKYFFYLKYREVNYVRNSWNCLQMMLINKFMIAFCSYNIEVKTLSITTMENTIFHLYKLKMKPYCLWARDMRNLIGKIGLGHVNNTKAQRALKKPNLFTFNAYGIVLIHNGNLTNIEIKK